MKKHFFVTVALCVIVAISQAQVKSTIALGLKAGITGSTQKLKSSSLSETSSERIGFVAGAFANLKLSKYFSLQPELLYNGIGSKDKNNSKEKIVLDYVSIPILAKVTYKNVGLYVGPQFGVLLNATSKDEDGSTKVKEFYKSPDVSLVLGADITFNFGLVFSARIQKGFSDISKTDGYSIKNSSAALTLGYILFKK